MKLLHTFLYLLLCGSLLAQPKNNKGNILPKKPSIKVIEENPMTFYTKSYKTKNGQGYERTVERFYYGLRNNAADLFRINDYKKWINSTEYIKYNKASFYPDGVYTMPEDKRRIALDVFSPILDSILRENTKSKKLHAEIVVFGFTDESPVDFQSKNYLAMCTLLKKENISIEEYNNHLSYLRAKDVGDMLTTLMAVNTDRLIRYEEALVDFIVEGRGIEYPDASREYELQDDKRKIVKVYWKIF